MTGRVSRLNLALLVAGLLGSAFAASPASAAEPTYGQPSAATTLAEPLVFTSTITGDDIAAVEVLVRLAGEETTVVVAAQPAAEPGTWQATAEIDIATSSLCACLADGHSPPNTRFEYQFRVRAADGTTTLGPVGEGIVSDERFAWQTLEEDLVRVHWYEGDAAFAQSALDVANGAIDRAGELLGTTLPEPVDLFVYATEEAMRSAISPNRENVAGQAHSSIDTMFVWIPPGQSAAGFAGPLVAHELTHLVMNEATDNPYSGVPRWIDEGVAVYLSEGYNQTWRAPVEAAVRNGTLIPLDGLRGFFPSSADQFYLAYGESTAAIEFFTRTYDEPTLWALVRSYKDGLSDDEAFIAATGQDVAAFNALWFESLGAEVPDPVGPQPGPAGPTPSAWQPVDGPSPSASSPPVAPPSPRPGGSSTASPGAPPGSSAVPAPASPAPTGNPGPTVTPGLSPAGDSTSGAVVGLVAGAALIVLLLLGFVLYQRSRPPRPPLV